MANPVVYVNPPARCDLCKGSFGNVMYDAHTLRGWANVCQECFDDQGCSLGTGRGQKYEKQFFHGTDKWVKTAG